MSLWDLPLRKTARITSILTSLDSKFAQRLLDLGFSEGETVLCVRHGPFGGAKIYQVGATLIALEDELARAIEIEPSPA